MSNPQTFADGYPLGPRHISRPPASHLAGHTGNTPRTNTPVFYKASDRNHHGFVWKMWWEPLKIPWFIASLLSIQQLPKDCQSTGWSCLKWPYISYILQLPAYSKIKELRVALPHRYPYYIHGFFPTSHGSGVALPCAHLTNAKFASNDYVMLQQEVVGGVESSSFDKSGGKPPIH